MSSKHPKSLSPSSLAKYIDHTQLRPDAVEADVKKACSEAREYGFYSVCLYPKWMVQASAWLKGSETIPITVVGFPSGEPSTASKVSETLKAVQEGAREIDMVLNRTLLKSGDREAVLNDIESVVEAAGGLPVKVILETSELSMDEVKEACLIAKEAGAHFVKTSTGFSSKGAEVEKVKLMAATVQGTMGVKASGGIRGFETALEMIEAGATRLGTSASIDIVKGVGAKGQGY